MNPKIKKIFTNVRIIILLAFILFAVVAIHPNFDERGVTIRTVAKDSAAANAIPNAIESSDPSAKPMNREVLYSINGQEMNSVEEYYDFVSNLEADKLLIISTSEGRYELTTQNEYEITILNETEIQNITKEIFDNETNQTINVTETREVNKTLKNIIGVEDIGLTVYEVASNNLRKGLDLEGGTRVILEPEEEISSSDSDMIIENIKQRLNVYGLSDIVVKPISDFDGHNYIMVEIAGANQEEVRDLLSKQGKFEAKVGEIIVFKGGNDIVHVCRDATCSGIDPRRGCGQSDDGNGGEGYLSKNISLYLDDELYDSLRISEGLKGNALTDISISGSGSGASQQEAALNTLDNMKKLQTVLITGSLPVKLDIAQSNAVSPVLGDEFIKNALLIGLLSLAGVIVVILLRYRQPILAVPIIVTMLSEIIILLGFAAVVGWRLDLAAIAGIIIAVGTGVDDQIVIVDETIGRKKSEENLSWIQKLKRAFGIIMTAYFTTVVAMIPLLQSGAGLLKGFALTTIVGVSIGVFITRPAFAEIIQIFVKEDLVE